VISPIYKISGNKLLYCNKLDDIYEICYNEVIQSVAIAIIGTQGAQIFCDPILNAICTSTFSRTVYKFIQCHVVKCSVALFWR
jgi:hypothetical protein